MITLRNLNMERFLNGLTSRHGDKGASQRSRRRLRTHEPETTILSQCYSGIGKYMLAHLSRELRGLVKLLYRYTMFWNIYDLIISRISSVLISTEKFGDGQSTQMMHVSWVPLHCVKLYYY